MTRLTLLFLMAAVVIPGAASALPAPDRDAGTRAALNAQGVDQTAADRKARAIEDYYASYGTVKPVEVAAISTQPAATGHDGPSWFGALGIGFGLILLAGGLGVYAGRFLRPRHLGA